MKRFFLLISLILVPLFSFAQQVIEFPNPLKAKTFEELIESIINFLTWAAIAISPLVAIIGAFFILTSGGNPQQIEKGKRTILYAIVALLLIFFAKGIVGMIKIVLTGK